MAQATHQKFFSLGESAGPASPVSDNPLIAKLTIRGEGEKGNQ